MAENDGVEIESHRTLRRGTKWADDGEMVSVGEEAVEEACLACEVGGTMGGGSGLVRTDVECEPDARGDFGRKKDVGSVGDSGDDCIIFFAGELLGLLGMNAHEVDELSPARPPSVPTNAPSGGEKGELTEGLVDRLLAPIPSSVSASRDPSVPPSRTMTGSPTHSARSFPLCDTVRLVLPAPSPSLNTPPDQSPSSSPSASRCE